LLCDQNHHIAGISISHFLQQELYFVVPVVKHAPDFPQQELVPLMILQNLSRRVQKLVVRQNLLFVKAPPIEPPSLNQQQME
jgi:hypothetical protein